MCPGLLIPTQRQCVKGKLVTSTRVSSSTGITMDDEFYLLELIKFFASLFTQEVLAQDNVMDAFAKSSRIVHGIFYFAPDPMLRLLPSDFGQNYITPYGLVSFGQSYASCIENPFDFCQYLTRSLSDDATKKLCKVFFEKKLLTNITCPFNVTTSQKRCDPQDPSFFDLIGMLGTFSIMEHQAVIVHGVIPLCELDLMYWSSNIYLADRVDPLNRCRPYRDLFFASILPPCNAWNCGIGLIDKGSHCQTPGYLRFYIVVSLHEDVKRFVENTIRSVDPLVDVVYHFEIPTAKGTFTVFPDMPNPNMMNSTHRVYNIDTDRLAFLFRFNNRDVDNSRFKKFMKEPGFLTYLIDTENIDISCANGTYCAPSFPAFLSPATNEVMSDDLLQKIALITRQCHDTFGGFEIKEKKWNQSLVNIMAPLSEDVHNGAFVYESGLQAIQLAGNALGDNHDTWYKTTDNICITGSDVLVTIAVNHNFYNNSLYSSINIIATKAQMGYDAITVIDAVFPIYIVVCGRDGPSVEKTCALLEGKITYPIYKIVLKTGSHASWKIPTDSPVAICERSYINPILRSSDGRLFDIRKDDLWGKVDMRDLQTITGPDGTRLVTPITYLLRKKNPIFNYMIIILVVVVATLLIYFLP